MTDAPRDIPGEPASTGPEEWASGVVMRAALSVVIVSLFKTDLTVRCVETLLRHTPGHALEIIVVNNSHGQRDDTWELRRRLAGVATVIGLGVSRSFAEANAIGAEAATADLIVFLNNDSFVTHGWLPPLLAALGPGVGAVAPKLVEADGRLQEVGGRITADGTSVAFGPMEPPDPPDLSEPRDVPYASAACLLMRRRDFFDAGGFSRRYEPAYYEDADLCLTLVAAGLRIICVPQSSVVHLRNRTSAEPGIFGRSSLATVVELNRARFLSVWGDHLQGSGTVPLAAAPDALASAPIVSAMDRKADPRPQEAPGTRRPSPAFWPFSRKAPPPASPLPRRRPNILVQLPEPPVVSSRMHAQLTAAMALADDCAVTLLCRFPVSKSRIAWLCGMLGIPPFPAGLADEASLSSLSAVDVLITCDGGSGRLNGLPGARRLHCLDDSTPDSLDTAFALPPGAAVSEAVACSHASRALWSACAGQAGVTFPPLRIIGRLHAGEPVRRPRPDGAELAIVAAGRIGAGGGGQRFDLLIEAARLLSERGVGYRLDIVGAIDPSASGRETYQTLVARAAGLPVAFHPDLPRAAYLRRLQADMVWHVARAGSVTLPFCVIEAIAAGCHPLVLDRSGSDAAHFGLEMHPTIDALAEGTQAWLRTVPETPPFDPEAYGLLDVEAFKAAWKAAIDG